MKEIVVNLKERSYRIIIKSGLLSDLGQQVGELLKTNYFCILTDENVANLYLADLKRAIYKITKDPLVIIVPPGEEQKNLTTISMIYDKLLENGFVRDSTILAFGGGVVGDIAGFAAATYMRGIDYIQIPTTLLAQVDSSVGGKTGVNHKLGKNMIGAFYQPKGVFIDPFILRTLSKRDIKSGLIEIIKHSIIKKSQLFEYIENNLDAIFELNADSLEYIIEVNCRIKAEIVSEDERESGVRALLNLGHTIGHALEKVSGYDVLRHGEAVGFGIIAASHISRKMGNLANVDFDRISNLILKIIPTSKFPISFSESIIESMALDKKKKEGKLRFVLPESIGKAFIRSEVSFDIIKESIEELKNKMA
ncbi:3-dehydroquinate synthase [bacterium]|nr:3-dehydroquinate synthase [bacterium]